MTIVSFLFCFFCYIKITVKKRDKNTFLSTSVTSKPFLSKSGTFFQKVVESEKDLLGKKLTKFCGSYTAEANARHILITFDISISRQAIFIKLRRRSNKFWILKLFCYNKKRMIPFYSSYQKAIFPTTRNCSSEKYISSKLIMIHFLTCKFIVTWKLRRLRSLPEGIIG